MATFPRGHHARDLHQHRITTTSVNTIPAKVTWTIDPSDAITLRGIPAIGPNVAGHIPGTRPDTKVSST